MNERPVRKFGRGTIVKHEDKEMRVVFPRYDELMHQYMYQITDLTDLNEQRTLDYPIPEASLTFVRLKEN